MVRTVNHAWSKFYGPRGPGGGAGRFLRGHTATRLKPHPGPPPDACPIFLVTFTEGYGT